MNLQVSWDLDHVVQQNSWEQLEEDVSENEKIRFSEFGIEISNLV